MIITDLFRQFQRARKSRELQRAQADVRFAEILVEQARQQLAEALDARDRADRELWAVEDERFVVEAIEG